MPEKYLVNTWDGLLDCYTSYSLYILLPEIYVSSVNCSFIDYARNIVIGNQDLNGTCYLLCPYLGIEVVGGTAEIMIVILLFFWSSRKFFDLCFR